MKNSFYALALAAALSWQPCAAQELASSASASGGSTSSIDAHDPSRIVATLRGSSGISVVQGDRVELKDHTLYLNGRSYGAVPASGEIQYIITKSGRTLYVDGKPRTRPANAK